MSAAQNINPTPLRLRTSSFSPETSEASKKTTLLFIHGWGSDSSVWQALEKELKKQLNLDEYCLRFLDLPGFGIHKSVVVENLEELLAQIELLLTPRSVIIGWSLGGMLATALARRKTTLGIVTLATNLSYVQRSGWDNAMDASIFDDFYLGVKEHTSVTLKRFYGLQGMGDEQRRLVSAELKKQTQPEGCHESLSWLKGLVWLKQLNNTGLHVDELGTTRGLHFFGDADVLVPVKAAELIEKKLACHQFHVFNCTGHALLLTKAEEIASRCSLFLSNSAAGVKLKNGLTVNQSPLRNKARVAESFSRAAQTYNQAADVQKKVADKLIRYLPLQKGASEKPLDTFHCENKIIVDLGCGTGYCTSLLNKNVTDENTVVIGLDIALGMLNRAKENITLPYVCADIEVLPFAPSTVSGLVSSFSLQWCENIHSVFEQAYRCLTKEGWFLFATVGPKTLWELSEAWASVDSHVHVNAFSDGEHVRKAAQSAGFSIETFETDIEVMEYESVMDLMRDLKSIGAHNINSGRNSGLTGKNKIKRLADYYQTKENHSGKLPATYEVYYCLLRKV